jgi:hypothetical protein
MQHEVLRPGLSGQGFADTTTDIPQDARAELATPAQQSEPQGEDATPPNEMTSPTEAPGETQEAEPAEWPPIAPPRSWTKDARAHWQTLPRETQAYVAAREQERERELRRSQNEAAERLKGLTAKELAAEQARQHYEAALPALLQALQGLHASAFADITSADVNKLAAADPSRFMAWQAHRTQMEMLEHEMRQARERQALESQAKWSAFASEQGRLLLAKALDLSDLERAQNVADSSVHVFKDIGFSDDELEQAWAGARFVSLRDHRIQLLVFESIRYREQRDAMEITKRNVTNLLPPVRRLAAASVQAALAPEVDAGASIQTLEQQLAIASGLGALKLGATIVALKQHVAAR